MDDPPCARMGQQQRTAGLRTYPRRSTGRTYEQLAPEQKKKKKGKQPCECAIFSFVNLDAENNKVDHYFKLQE
jgi:hypothetical protein